MISRLFNCLIAFSLCGVGLSACSTYSQNQATEARIAANDTDYASRLPDHMTTSEKMILVDPNVHAWGAYDAEGSLIRAGLATAGSNWCPDLGRPCHTKIGSFRIRSLGGADCKSSLFPLHRGGAKMPFCMFFNAGQALHGVPEGEVVEGNISHGCVRLHVNDAEWIRYNFADLGTRVVIRPYD